jgi:putative PIN family toxin of toxin-antitoxin system
MRIVLDSNIIVTGLLSTKGPPGFLLRAWVEEKFILITSQTQLAELRRVMQYKHLRARINPTLASDLFNSIDSLAVVLPSLREVNLSLDPDDNIILATAVDGLADLIVSGDKRHMLSLQRIGDIPIVMAKEAVDRL